MNTPVNEAMEQLNKKLEDKRGVFVVALLHNNGPDLTPEYVKESNDTYKTFINNPCCEILK